MEDLPTYDGQGYCVKCREKKAITGAAVEKTKKGTYMARTVCPDSGTTICVIIGRTWPKEA